MVEIIAAAVFFGSVAGMGMLLSKKMPQARQSLEIAGDTPAAGFLGGCKVWLLERIKRHPRFKDFNWIDFAQKQLLKVKVVVMKTENKINDYTQKLKSRAEQQQKTKDSQIDEYWRDLKTIIRAKKPRFDQKNSGQKPAETKIGGESQNSAKAPFENYFRRVEPAAEPAPLEVGRAASNDQSASRQNRQAGRKKQPAKKKRFGDPFRW